MVLPRASVEKGYNISPLRKRCNAAAVVAARSNFSRTVLGSTFAAVALFLPWKSVAAGARDEVIGTVFRCAAIPDMRTWLECYYGAAQPVRASLRMQPAPPGQIQLSHNPPTGQGGGELRERYETTENMLRCNDIRADREWLDCYYAAAQPVRATLGLSPAPQTRLASVDPNHEDGRPHQASVAAGLAGHNETMRYPISATMSSFSFNKFGMFTVLLDNGQTWRQLSGDTNYAHWVKPAHYSVTITHGMFGSLNLQMRGSPVAYKVERIS